MIWDAIVINKYILILKDLEFVNFLEHESAEQLKTRINWIHIQIPGQGDGDLDLPTK